MRLRGVKRIRPGTQCRILFVERCRHLSFTQLPINQFANRARANYRFIGFHFDTWRQYGPASMAMEMIFGHFYLLVRAFARILLTFTYEAQRGEQYFFRFLRSPIKKSPHRMQLPTNSELQSSPSNSSNLLILIIVLLSLGRRRIAAVVAVNYLIGHATESNRL